MNRQPITKKEVTIYAPAQTSVILDLIHDCWFNVRDVLLDRETSVLSIKFKREELDKSRVLKKTWFLKKIEVPVVECLLKIHTVKAYTIRDTEQVELYDFNELEYDPRLKRISITTGVPLDITIYVESFKVSVEETDKVIDIKKKTSIFS